MLKVRLCILGLQGDIQIILLLLLLLLLLNRAIGPEQKEGGSHAVKLIRFFSDRRTVL